MRRQLGQLSSHRCDHCYRPLSTGAAFPQIARHELKRKGRPSLRTALAARISNSMGDSEIGRAKASPSRCSHADWTGDCTSWDQCVNLVVVDNGMAVCCDSAECNYCSACEGIAFDRD